MAVSPYTALVASVLFPLHERLKGHGTVRLRRELERSQWWSGEQLQELQMERLRALLEVADRHMPFFHAELREQGMEPADFRDAGDLARLPITDKALIRRHGDSWPPGGIGPAVRQQTSGSSGEPLRFALGRGRIGFDTAAKWRGMRWWSVDVGDPEVVVWGSVIESAAQGSLRRLRDRVLRSQLLPTGSLDDQRLSVILRALRARRPRMVFGYPSALARIAWAAHERGVALDDLGVRVVFTTSEVLQPEWRRIIEAVFAAPVANEYGARDAGFIGRECPEGGLHVSAEGLIVEAVDEAGQPVAAGESGELLVTNLVNPEFPFIRYRTGDRGILDNARCACGRGLPLIREIAGRSNDGLRATGGGWVHGSAFNHLMRELDGLQSYRIVQTEPTRVWVGVVLDGELSVSTRQRLAARFREYLGPELVVDIEPVERLDAEANGKFRHVVCQLDEAP